MTGAATPGESNRAAPCVGVKTPASNPLGDLPPVPTLEPTHGQAGGPPGSIAQAKLAGLDAWIEMDGVVTARPGLFSRTLYVADPAGDSSTAGIGVAVYLENGEFPPLAEGDVVHLAGRWDSYHGEMELVISGPEQIWKLRSSAPLRPLPLAAGDVREWVEGRLVTFRGVVTDWEGDSLLLADPSNSSTEPVRVTVRSSLPWQRPHVDLGEIWQVTGIVSQYAARSPWNGGYRLMPRYPQDLVCLSLAQ